MNSTHYGDLSTEVVFDLTGLDSIGRMLIDDLEKLCRPLAFCAKDK